MKINNLIPLRKKVAFETLGCRLNIAETGSLKEMFVAQGYQVVSFDESADVVVINTCTVTDGADQTCRNIIRKARKNSPQAKVVVIGCYAQVASEEIAKIEGVDLILGTSEKHKILDHLEAEEQIIRIDRSSEFWGAATSSVDNHTRAFLKIQDGCNYVCAYCIIPFARGRSRAMERALAIKEAKALVEKGFKEIILSGVNIGEYQNLTGESLPDLTEDLLNIEGLERLRFSSVEPNTVTDELLKVWVRSPKITDYFHIPLQSGDDEILKAMRRKYSVAEYSLIVERLKKAFPNAGIGADVIVGFPGETDENFENTYRLMEKLPLTHFHVFPYSKRKGTTASTLKNEVSHAVKKERVKKLIELGQQKMELFAQSQVGLKNSVLFEKKNDDGFWEGYTTNFLPTKLESQEDLKNQIRSVEIISAERGELLARLV